MEDGLWLGNAGTFMYMLTGLFGPTLRSVMSTILNISPGINLSTPEVLFKFK